MRFRLIILGAFALPVISGGSAPAQDGDVYGQGSYMVAQAADSRVTQLEEMVRRLTGQVEELNFQILQMQEQIRKMQEDNEFRFQELEGGGSGAAQKTERRPQSMDDAGAAQVQAENLPSSDEAEASAGGSRQRAAPPRMLGTITFDEHGNPKGGVLDIPEGLAGPGHEMDGEIVAALPPTDDPDELYRNSYEFILSGDYGTAEAGFRDHIERYPADPNAADARYWLGEALLGQDRYRDAAEVFLDASRSFPDARKAPEMMLKLGISLAALNQRDVACATYGEIGRRYPQASATLHDRVKQEQAVAGC
jgi:tol-pal system protein YbgF